MQVSKTRLKIRSLIMYHKNSTDKIFRDQNNEKHERKIVSPPLDNQKSKSSKIYQREMKSNDTKRNLKILTRKLKKMIPIEKKYKDDIN